MSLRKLQLSSTRRLMVLPSDLTNRAICGQHLIQMLTSGNKCVIGGYSRTKSKGLWLQLQLSFLNMNRHRLFPATDLSAFSWLCGRSTEK